MTNPNSHPEQPDRSLIIDFSGLAHLLLSHPDSSRPSLDPALNTSEIAHVLSRISAVSAHLCNSLIRLLAEKGNLCERMCEPIILPSLAPTILNLAQVLHVSVSEDVGLRGMTNGEGVGLLRMVERRAREVVEWIQERAD